MSAGHQLKGDLHEIARATSDRTALLNEVA